MSEEEARAREGHSSQERPEAAPGPLHDEEALLGAVFGSRQGADGPVEMAMSYPGIDEDGALAAGCGLCDASYGLARLVSGAQSQAYMEAALAGRRLAVGECAFEALLGGDGALMGAPLAARTGEAEYGIWDLSPRGRLSAEWLSFLAGIEQDGYRPFADVRLEGVAGRLVSLLLWGPSARAVLDDYLHDGEALPEAGHVANLLLDRIDCLVAAPAGLDGCWLVMVPAGYARVLWRSFLSFEAVQPVGKKALDQRLGKELGWYAQLSRQDRVQGRRHDLKRQGLLRADGGFVGERGLKG